MTAQETIFVQIASYRDPELVPTLRDLFAKAARPERIFVGICWQYQPGEEPEHPEVDAPPAQLRWRNVPISESHGVCWARAQVQTLYEGEDFMLSIDSHMRFAPKWDEMLIEEWRRCDNPRAVLSHLPPGYTPPDTLAADGKPTFLRVLPPHPQTGEIRVHGERFTTVPDHPLPGAFAAAGCHFGPGSIITDIPYDPYLYFEQEEICLSARLYTHGYDVFHPSCLTLYHLYKSDPARPRRNHWEDHTAWGALNRRARERRDALLGYKDSVPSPDAVQELERYGLGTERSLAAYSDYCGIDFTQRRVSDKTLNGGFIPNLARYRTLPIVPPQEEPSAFKENTDSATAAKTPQPEVKKIPSAFTGVPVAQFTPVSTDILAGLGPEARLRDAPPGVLIMDRYAPPDFCQKLCDYADTVAGRKLQVVDNDLSTGEKVITRESAGRVTDYVTINGAAATILPTFIDIYANRLAPYYGVDFEWFERPQILRYPPGGKYDPHADAEHIDAATRRWVRAQDRDISVLLYLNNGYEGGAIAFPDLDYAIKPETGMLLAFPSDHRYLHAARPTTSGMRYVIVSWAASLGTPRVRPRPPYACVHLKLP